MDNPSDVLDQLRDDVNVFKTKTIKKLQGLQEVLEQEVCKATALAEQNVKLKTENLRLLKQIKGVKDSKSKLLEENAELKHHLTLMARHDGDVQGIMKENMELEARLTELQSSNALQFDMYNGRELEAKSEISKLKAESLKMKSKITSLTKRCEQMDHANRCVDKTLKDQIHELRIRYEASMGQLRSMKESQESAEKERKVVLKQFYSLIQSFGPTVCDESLHLTVSKQLCNVFVGAGVNTRAELDYEGTKNLIAYLMARHNDSISDLRSKYHAIIKDVTKRIRADQTASCFVTAPPSLPLFDVTVRRASATDV
jgi:chromosome segregation ATPase